MNAATIASHLSGRRSGTGYSCLCPAHPDKTRSLSVADALDGKILAHCHAGCEQGAVIAALKDRGLWPETAQTNNGHNHHRKPLSLKASDTGTGGTGAKPLCAAFARAKLEHDGWFFHSEGCFGDLHRQVRFQHVTKIQDGKSKPEKTFRWEHRVGDEWFSGAGETTPPIYFNRTAMQSGGSPAFLLLVEGWGKADAADTLGIACASFKEVTAENADSLADFPKIVIWPDNDEPGQKLATTEAELIRQHNRRVHTLRPPAELPLSGDIVDAIALGRGKDRILELIHAAEPTTSLTSLVETFQKWLYLPDTYALLTVLSIAVANLINGDPVWLLLVGAPGSGKTEMLQTLATLPRFHPAATLTEASLLSGTPKREHSGDATGGLLRVIGEHGTILLKDFGSVLSMPRDPRAALLAALREVFDGSWTRQIGTDGGRSLSWTGKCGLLAGCTPAIDSHHAVMASLGERFLLYRLPVAESDELAKAALKHVGNEKAMRAELSAAVAAWFRGLELPQVPGTLSDAETNFIVSLATLVVRARSSVERDYRTREIDFVPDSEAPGRLARCLAQLLGGAKAIGIPEPERRQLVRKVALDCVPALRLRALEVLVKEGREMSTSSVAEAVGHPTATVRRTLEDLNAHSILERRKNGAGKADVWSVSDWAVERWNAIQ